MKNRISLGLLLSAFSLLFCPRVQAASYSFLVYGDNRAGADCSSNQAHLSLINRMKNEPASMVFNVGDMITGYSNTTNWVQNGPCTGASDFGSFKNQIAPLQSKSPTAGLPAFYFPVVGNHDDNWSESWYPDPFGDGFCDVFPSSLLQSLVKNHTAQPYFKDKSGRVPLYTDSEFYSNLCSKTVKSVYPTYLYYSFDFQNTHMVVLRINSDYYDLLTDNAACVTSNNYDGCYNVHQLHWLQDDLAKAKANPAIKHIFAFLHAPVYTTSDGHYATLAGTVLAQEFSKYSVKAVFSGHNHVYERTFPIYASASNPGGARNDQTGTSYVVTGGGGSAFHGFRGSAWFDAKRDARYHYMRVQVTDTGVTVSAVDNSGTVFDTFSIGSTATTSACDVNSDGSTNVSDVQSCVNQAIGAATCGTGDIDGSGTCNIVDVQRTVNAVLGGVCVIQ